jgi:DNA topoisomerase VI subunit B
LFLLVCPEFVENSLDAAESAGVLPLIDVRVEKLSTAQFNGLRGIDTHARADLSLYEPAAKSKGKGRKPAVSDASPALSQSSAAGAVAGSAGAAAAAVAASGAGGDAGEEDDKSRPSFFRVTCRDNGSGIRHDLIPNSLGVVLSSTKYGVKQTRGKFGLGAKMALVWAKKSTGLPVEILSATSSKGDVSYCKLDIDIYKNTPRVLAHQQQANEEQWRGLEISVVIGGKWQSYQAKVLNYLKQLAVITPYAQINMEYIDAEAER